MSVGKTILSQATGRPVQVTADGAPIWLPVGVSVAWDLVTAAGAAGTLEDDTPYVVGEKYIVLGTVLVELRQSEVETLTINATGGTYTITAKGVTTAAIAYNAAASVIQTALEAIYGVGNVTVTGSAGGPYTVTWNEDLGDVAAPTTNAGSLTGGAGTAAFTTPTGGNVLNGYWAPFDSSQTDGRQTLARAHCGILNRTIKQAELSIMGANVEHELTGLIEGGLVWKERLKVGGTNQPTLANLLAAMPRLSLTPDV